MACVNPLNSQNKAMEIVLDDCTGTKPVPSAALINPIKITTSSMITMDLSPMNPQDDIAKGNMSPEAELPSVRGGTANFEFNLTSTDQLLEPSVLALIKCCKFSVKEEQLIVLGAAAANVVEGDVVLGDTSGATGVVAIVDDTLLIVNKDLGSADFEAAETISQGASNVGTVDNVDNKSYYVYPDSESVFRCSVFMYTDGTRDALYKCAGTLSLTMETGGLIKATGTLIGKEDLDNTNDIAVPEITFADTDALTFLGSQMNFAVEDVVTPYIPVNKSAELTLGSTTSMLMNSVDDTGYESGEVDSRAGAGATVVIMRTLLADFDPRAIKRDAKDVAFSFRMGSGTIKKTCYVRANKARFSEPQATSDNNIEYFTIPMKFTGDSDNEQYWVFI